MLDVRVGKLSTIGVHVVVSIVKNLCEEGFEKKDGFVIQDVNTENRPGQPKFQAEVEAVTHVVNASDGVLARSWVDIDKLGNLVNLLDYLVEIKKGENKIKVAIDFGEGHMSRTALQQLVILATRYKNDLSITVFMTIIEDIKEIKKIVKAVEGMIQLKKDLNVSSAEFEVVMKHMYQNNLLSPSTANIVESTYGMYPDLTGKKVILVDTHNFFYRSYHGMADLRNQNGDPTGLIKGFTTFLKQIKAANPDYIVFLSEGHGSFRKTEYEAYKANREAPPADLIFQINVCNSLLESMGMTVFKVDGFEADDGIASFAKRFGEANATVEIYSTDKDLYQLITDNVKIRDTVKNILIDSDYVFNHPKFGVYPNQMIDFQSIVGDTSDNVPGLKGQGPKGAATLLNEFGSLEGIYENISKLKGKQKETFETEKEMVNISRVLVKLYTSLAEDVNLEDYVFPQYDFFKLIFEELRTYEIHL